MSELLSYFRFVKSKDGKLSVYPTQELLTPHGDTLVALEIDPSKTDVSIYWETQKAAGEQDLGLEECVVESTYEGPVDALTLDTPLVTLSQYKFKQENGNGQGNQAH